MKNAIIIGATSGIGLALARKLVSEGWKVGITGRRQGLLEKTAMESPEGSMEISCFDATLPGAPEKTKELIERLGGLDLFIFNAGTGDLEPEFDHRISSETNNLNVVAFATALTDAYLYFRQKGGGHIVAVSSTAGIRGLAASPSYGASKAYQINFMEGLRQRSAKENDAVTVTDIRPGPVDTNMLKGEGFFWVTTPAKAAEIIYRAIVKQKKVQYVSRRWKLAGVILKIIPRWFYDRM